MTRHSDDTMFRYAAASYLRSWIVIDSRYHNGFTTNLTTDILGELLREYRAVRNFKKKNKNDGHERFQKFADVLTRIRTAYVGANTLNAVAIVNQINSEIIPDYQSDKHKNFLSAASKTAWMLFRHPVAIYDSLACEALQSLNYPFVYGDYEGYYGAWEKYQSANQAKIEAAALWVATSDFAHRIADHGIATMPDIAAWASSDWFHNRICDQRLVWLGSKDDLPIADLAALISRNELP